MEELGPISTLIWAIDLPDGLIGMMIRDVDGMKACGQRSGCQLCRVGCLGKIRLWRMDSARHMD